MRHRAIVLFAGALAIGCGLAVLADLPPQAAADDAPGKDAPGKTTFELRVVGPDRKPVPEASVELRTRPIPAAEQIVRGKFVRQGAYGAFVATDADGRLAIRFAEPPKDFQASITTPGYGPYWAGWSSQNSEPLPAQFTAELEAGWSIGGVVVDEQGKPVEGATLHPRSIDFKKRPGDMQRLGIGVQIKTDAAGKWRFDSVPVSLDAIAVEIGHPAFRPTWPSLARSEFGIAAGREPTATIRLDRGLTVTGKVTDESGKPIAEALIRTRFGNEMREARSGEDGVYRLGGCQPGLAKLVISATGKAVDMRQVQIEPQMEPVDFVMQPGRTVRVRVLDAEGKPVPKARIFFQRWRGPDYRYFELRHVNQYADENGVWVWNEAPADEFQADIAPPSGMSLWKQTLVARDEEYVFRTPPALVVSGQVVDADTRQPVERFQVMRGWTDRGESPFWHRDEQFTSNGGRYRLRLDEDRNSHYVRIEASGYRPAVSREIKSNEGAITIDFALEKGKDIVGRVVTPELQPAAKARVVLAASTRQIQVENGSIVARSQAGQLVETDDAGRFQLPPPDGEFHLVITHPSGYVHLETLPERDEVRVIRLQPWARVEGTFQPAGKSQANVTIGLEIHDLNTLSGKSARVHWEHVATTGPDGRFVFERVAPGNGRIGRRMIFMAGTGQREVTSTAMTPLTAVAGETKHIALGGSGRAVVGKLVQPADFAGKMPWNMASIALHIADDEKRDSTPYFWAAADREGNFRIDDVPEGRFLLSVHVEGDGGFYFARDRAIVVPAPARGDVEQPVEAGALTLQKSPQQPINR